VSIGVAEKAPPSPVVSAGAHGVLEMVEPLVVPDDDLAAGDLGDELDGAVAVPADAQVLHDPERRADQPERDGQALAVVHERARLGALVDVVQHVPRVRHVPRRADLLVHLPQLLVRLPPLRPDGRVLRPLPCPWSRRWRAIQDAPRAPSLMYSVASVSRMGAATPCPDLDILNQAHICILYFQKAMSLTHANSRAERLENGSQSSQLLVLRIQAA
jgi:hypothetical protein